MKIIELTPELFDQLLSQDEIEEEFFGSSGPGGQNVNKVETAVRLKWYLANSQIFSEDVIAYLLTRMGPVNGWVVIECQQHRTQLANRKAAKELLSKKLIAALEVPKKRKQTKPSKFSQEQRLDKKKKHGQKKKERQSSWE